MDYETTDISPITKEDIKKWCKRQNSKTLGKQFDISDEEGVDKFSEWLFAILLSVGADKVERENSA